jgi:chromate transporter
MRRYLVVRHGWLTPEEFVQDWTLAKTSPGITLVALAALIGSRLDGRRGVVAAVVGLLGPSAAIVIAVTIGFASVRDMEVVAILLDGVGPATLGMTIALAVIFIRSAIRQGRARFIDLLVVAIAIAAGVVVGSPIPVILGGTVLGWAFLGESRPSKVATVEDADNDKHVPRVDP